MSKYQPRIIINNPEKNVPDNIIEQFFLTLKTGDIDQIRNFTLGSKNKYSIIEKLAKDKSGSSYKTPYHVVLELDDKIANTDNKLRIMEFLKEMGAPMDLPDIADIWPIHLAAASQSPEIVDFFIKNGVAINRKDSSNNTPLHYAVIGREIPCPRSISVGTLVPEKSDKKILNQTLENTNKFIVRLLSKNPTINDNLIHIINTLMKIPEMYADDTLTRKLETDIIEIFSDTGLDPAYVSGTYTSQQAKLEQLIERYSATVTDDTFRGLISPLSISANNTGWGPNIPTGNPAPNDKRLPNTTERILETDRLMMRREIDNQYQEMRNSVVSFNTTFGDQFTRTDVPRILEKINTDYLDPLIICPECTTETNYGETISLMKIFMLLAWNYAKTNYPRIITRRIMQQTRLLSIGEHGQVVNNGIYDTNRLGYLFNSRLTFSVANYSYNSNFDRLLIDVIVDYNPSLDSNNCIHRNLRPYIPKPDDTLRNNIQATLLNMPLRNLIQNPNITNSPYFKNDLNITFNIPGPTYSFMNLLLDLIRTIRPRPPVTQQNTPIDIIF